MDWEEYPHHEENRQVIDAGAKLIAGILTLAIVAAVIGCAAFGWFEILPLFVEGE